jgi:hypothetical protein
MVQVERRSQWQALVSTPAKGHGSSSFPVDGTIAHVIAERRHHERHNITAGELSHSRIPNS